MGICLLLETLNNQRKPVDYIIITTAFYNKLKNLSDRNKFIKILKEIKNNNYFRLFFCSIPDVSETVKPFTINVLNN